MIRPSGTQKVDGHRRTHSANTRTSDRSQHWIGNHMILDLSALPGSNSDKATSIPSSNLVQIFPIFLLWLTAPNMAYVHRNIHIFLSSSWLLGLVGRCMTPPSPWGSLSSRRSRPASASSAPSRRPSKFPTALTFRHKRFHAACSVTALSCHSKDTLLAEHSAETSSVICHSVWLDAYGDLTLHLNEHWSVCEESTVPNGAVKINTIWSNSMGYVCECCWIRVFVSGRLFNGYVARFNSYVPHHTV